MSLKLLDKCTFSLSIIHRQIFCYSGETCTNATRDSNDSMNAHNLLAMCCLSRLIIVPKILEDSDNVSFKKKGQAALSQYINFRDLIIDHLEIMNFSELEVPQVWHKSTGPSIYLCHFTIPVRPWLKKTENTYSFFSFLCCE